MTKRRHGGTGSKPRRRHRSPEHQEAVIGGRRAVLEALKSGRATRVLTVAGLHETEGMRELLEGAKRSGVEIETTDEQALTALGLSDHQGVGAVARPPEELEERQVHAAPFGPDSVVVMLDGITDPQNLGASARAAEAGGAEMLVVRKRRSAPLSQAAVRASAGALFHLPVARVANLSRTVGRLKERGFFVVGLDHEASMTIHEAGHAPRPLVLVVGSEDVGLSRLVRESCDLLVAIPMVGQTASLNAASALAVGLFAYALRPT